MISLYYSIHDQYGLYGIRHFIERTGIAVGINKPSSSGIVIAYGTEAKGKFVIKIEKNEVKDHICGRVSIKNEKIPVCETPHDTGPGQDIRACFETADTRYPCVTGYCGGITIGIDIFQETGFLLSGHLDRIRDTLDTENRGAIAAKPMVDILENILFSSILDACQVLKIPLVQKSYWPENRPFAVCLTHDVDELRKTYQYYTRSVLSLIRGDIRGLKVQVNSLLQKIQGNEPYWTYDEIAAIERTFHAKSTYFILKESGRARLFSKKTWSVYARNRSFQGPEMQALVRKLKANGDEIGIHGSYFSFENPQLLKEETRELEQVISETIVGTRQHHLNLNVPGTWEHQIQAGLKYDSSLGFKTHGLKDEIGFRWGTSFPFFPLSGKEILPILEIPLIIMDICLDAYNDKNQAGLTIAEEVRRYHGVLTLLWHPRSFISGEYPHEREVYINISQYCQDKGAWFARGGDIFKWLSIRNRQTYSCVIQDSTCTINPSDSGNEFFFTLYLPQDTKGTILSKNADIIGGDENYICIKSNNLIPEDTIVIDFS
jgi:hypothetical protein